MSILSGPEIRRLVATTKAAKLSGHYDPAGGPWIDVDPFVAGNINPNSLDLTLSPDLLVYGLGGGNHALDPRAANPTIPVVIPFSGLELRPGTLYLASTVERTESHRLVPVLHGKSSVGRLGLCIHITAGFGDDGFGGPKPGTAGLSPGCQWTLEMTCVHPVRVYPGMRICQLVFEELVGERQRYAGRYADQAGPVASRFHVGEAGA